MIVLNKVNPKNIELLDSEENSDKLSQARKAAEAHRRVRQNIQQKIKPGISLKEICETVEGDIKILLKNEKNFGIGFPTGVSLNSCAAHFSMNPKDEDIFLTDKDVLKIDFGTHVNGYIMDSAFTVCFDPTKENLLLASKEATTKAIEMLDVDTYVADIGEVINEIISGYETEIDGKVCKIRPVSNLNGHSIDRFNIHSGITIPQVKYNTEERIVDDKFYAIETFATTGKGYVVDGGDSSHYSAGNFPKIGIKNPKSIEIYKTIKEKIGTLPFSPRNLEYYLNYNTHPFLKMITKLGGLEDHPPLIDSKGSYVAQFEHTVYIGNGIRENLTVGDDY